jgi:hypothetical protein
MFISLQLYDEKTKLEFDFGKKKKTLDLEIETNLEFIH